jgi:hypothetical protein
MCPKEENEEVCIPKTIFFVGFLPFLRQKRIRLRRAFRCVPGQDAAAILNGTVQVELPPRVAGFRAVSCNGISSAAGAMRCGGKMAFDDNNLASTLRGIVSRGHRDSTVDSPAAGIPESTSAA